MHDLPDFDLFILIDTVYAKRENLGVPDKTTPRFSIFVPVA